MADAITRFAEWLEELDGYVRAGMAHPNVKETVNSMEMIVHSCLDEQLAGISSLCFPSGAAEGSVQDGVPGVLRRSVEATEQVNKLLADLRSELLRFLEIFMQEHVLERSRPADAAAHGLPVARACCYVFRRDSSAKVKELCFHPLTYCLDLKELCPDKHELSEFVFGEVGHNRVNEPSLVDVVWKEHCKAPSKSTPTVRGGCLKLLGQIARCFPVEASNCTYFRDSKVYDRCMATLAAELKPDAKAPKLAEVAGALAGLGGLMLDTELSPSAVDQIFCFVLHCLNFNVDEQKRYTVPREALMLLGNNLPVFAAELPAKVGGEWVDGPRLADSLLLTRGASLWDPLNRLAEHQNQYLRPLAHGVLREVVHSLAMQVEMAAADSALRDVAVGAHNALMASLHAQASAASASARPGSTLRVRCELSRSVRALQGPEAVLAQLVEMCRFARGHFAPHGVRHLDQARAEVESRVSELPAFLEAFSILLPNVPAGLGGQRSTLVELLHDMLMFLHSHFTRLTPGQRLHAAGAMQQLLAALTAEPDALEDLLSRTTFPALVLIVDATAGLAAGPGSLRVAFATDLWSPLLDPDTPPPARFAGQTRRRGHTKYVRSGGGARRAAGGEDYEARHEACSRLLEHILRALTRMLQSFDLAMIPAGDADEPAAAGGGAGREEGELAEPGYDTGGGGLLRPMGLSAAAEVANRGDLFLFLGTVRFCEALLPALRPDLFVRWVHVLLIDLVGLASRSPHISGFVKLLRAVLAVCARCDYFESGSAGAVSDHSRERCYTMLRAFLLSLLCRARRLKDELFASAAGLLLSSPRRFVAEQLAQREAPLVMLLRHALNLGHAYKPLAHLSVAALEDWTDHLAGLLQPHLPVVLPALRDYLTVAADAPDALAGGGASGDKVGRRGLARTHTRRPTRAREARGEEELLQARVVRLLGRAGGDVVLLVDADAAAPSGGEVRWELQPRVALRAPLVGERDLHLHLDDVLPRVLDLATSSLAYREKAAACELLEACVKLTVGLNRDDAADFSAVNSRLYPAVLRLATDADGFVRGLFEPLALQLIHWIAKPSRSRSAGPTRDSLLMLEALMGAMSDGSHPGLREFGARCLAEFVRYALKHKADTSDRSPHAVRALLQRLCSLARNPDPLKRLSFAFALNSCYRELREDADTLDEALLELLYNSLLALRLADSDPPALGTADALCEVIDRLEKMLVLTAAPLRERNERRAIFVPGLGGSDGFAGWLLSQTTQRQARARLRCCQLFESAAAVAIADGRPGASARWVSVALTSGELPRLPAAARFASDAESSWRRLSDGAAADPHELPGWLAEVQAALDCSFWTVTQGHAPVCALLDPKGDLHPALGCLNVLTRECGADGALARRLAEAGQEGGWAGGEAVAEPSAPLCDALRSALRLIKWLLRRAASPASAASPLAAVDVPAARAAARAALLTPADVGCEPGSAAPRTFRLRELAAEVLASAHAQDRAATAAELSRALAELTPPLLGTQLGKLGQTTQDTIGLHAMVDGLLRLHVHAPAALEAALPGGRAEFALSLARLAHSAPASTRPLELGLLSASLDLASALGLDTRSLVRLACDPDRGPAFSRRFGQWISLHLASACAVDAEGVLGELIGGGGGAASDCGREPWAAGTGGVAGAGHADLLAAPGFRLLLQVLERLEASPRLPAEPAVAAARRRLDGLMAPAAWPVPARVGGVLRLARLLVSLSPATALRSRAGAPSELFIGLLKLLKPPPGFSREQAAGARTQVLKLLPSLLRALRPSALAAERKCLLDAVREMLEDQLPLRFSELGASRREEVEAMWIPLLDALADQTVRSAELLFLLLRLPAVTQPAQNGRRHALADGVRSAALALVRAASAAPTGPGAAPAELWRAAADDVMAEPAGGAQVEHREVLHLWVALPLIEAAQSEEAVLQLVAPSMPVLAGLWADGGWVERLPTDPAALSAELVRRRAAFDWMRAVISRVTPAHLEPGGRLLSAAGDAPPDKLKQQMVKVSAKAAKEAIDTPGLQQGRPGANLSDADRAARSDGVRRRAVHAAAYDAFCEIVLRTQSKPETVNKLLFNFSGLWRNAIDPDAHFLLRPTADFGTTSVGAAMAAGAAPADGGAQPRVSAGAGYLPSQALAFSSLSQDVSGGGAADGALGSSHTIGRAMAAAERASQASQSEGASQGYGTGAMPADTSGGAAAVGAGGVASGSNGAGLALEDEFDLDELNGHPVVRVLMRSIGQLRARGLEAEEERGMPTWMGKLLDTISDASASYSTRLLVAKLVYNLRDTPAAGQDAPHGEPAARATTNPARADAAAAALPPTLFAEHASHWFKPLSRLVLESLHASDCFNYLARDLLTLMASWPAAELPTDDDELHALLAHVLEKAMARCGDDRSDVLRQNVRAVRALLELAAPRLGTKLQVRRLVVYNMIKARYKDEERKEVRTRTTGLHLLNALMRNGLAYADDQDMLTMAGGHWRRMVPAGSPALGTGGPVPDATYIPATPAKMHEALFGCLKHRLKPVYSAAALVLGETLAQMSGGRAGGAAGGEPGAVCGTGWASSGAGMAGAAATHAGVPPPGGPVGGSVAQALLPDLELRIQRHLYESATSDYTQANIGKLLVQLDGLSAGFPRLLDLSRRQLGVWVQHKLGVVHGDARVAALRCLAHAARRERAIAEGLRDEPPLLFGAEDAGPVTRLTVEQWASVLSQQQSEVQRAALDLLAELVHVMPPPELYPLLPTLDAAVARHRELECRAAYQEVLIVLRRRAAESGMPADPASEAYLRTGLLLGLRDPDPGRRATMLAYWHLQLPTSAADRLVACFDELYTPAVEAHWLHSSAVLLLELVRAAPNYGTPVFDQSLEEGLALQVVALAPTFGSASAAMQPWGTSFFTQSQAEGEQADPAGALRATQPLVFSMTQSQHGIGAGHAATYSSQPAGAPPTGSRGRAAPPPVPHFGAPASQAESSAARSTGPAFADEAPVRRRAAAAAAGGRRRAAAVAAARASQPVVAMRCYRAGEIPDIALTPHDFFAPLSALTHHDPLVAKRTLVHLYQAIRTQRMAVGGDGLDRLHVGVGRLLGSRAGGPAFVACLHDLALTEEDTSGWLDPDLVSSSALRTGTVHSAVRLIEAQLVAAPAAPRPAKRSRGGAAGREGGGCGESGTAGTAGQGSVAGSADPRDNRPALLLELYRALGEEDIVRGLAVEVASSAHLRSAFAAEARGDSEAALELYEGALGALADDGLSQEAAQLAQRGRRECLMQLGRWEELRDASEQLLAAANSGLGSWREAAHEPWLRMLLVSAAKGGDPESGWRSWRPVSEGGTGSEDGWPHPDRDKELLLELGLGSLLVLDRLASGSDGGARALLPEAVGAFIGRWATLHPLAASARLAELPQLQLLTEAGELLSALEQPLVVEETLGSFRLSGAVGGLLRSWDGRFPSTSRHRANVWDDLVCSRRLMLSVLRRKVRSAAQAADEEEREQLEAQVELASARSLLTVHTRAAAAVRAQGDFAPARSHVLAAMQIRGKHPNQLPSADLSHNVGMLRHRLQKSLAREGLGGSVQAMQEVWAQVNKLAGKEADAAQRAELCELRADVAVQLLAAGRDEAPGMLAEAREALERLLAEAANGGGELTAARLKLVDLCVSELRRPARSPSQSDSAVARSAVRQVALAMAAGSLPARDRLPTALSLLRGRPEAWDEASELLGRPPAWMALKWTSQLLAVLHEPHGEAVAGLLQRVAEEYPSRLYHPFTLSRPTLQRRQGLGPRARACVGQLGTRLRSPHLEALAAAFEDLTHPNLRLKDEMDQVIGLLREGKVDKAAAAYVGGTGWMREGGRGRLLSDFAKKFLDKMDALCGRTGEKLRGYAGAGAAALAREVSELSGQWRQWVSLWEQGHAAERERLSTFSPFLASYHAADEARGGTLEALELPAASDADADPSRLGRVVAHSFGGALPTMESLRRPKRLTVHGSDARERRYLVKGGEDLRQDQRVQQLFRVVNSVLAADGQCAARGLAMRTYAVLPLNDRVGLIEWVDGTSTLLGLIRRADRAGARAAGPAGLAGRARTPPSALNQADARFRDDSLKPAKGLPRWLAMPSREAVGMLDRAHAAVPADLLARGLLSLSVGAEAVLAVRSAFARSLAALTIAGHVLGIGDRHLDNFLVEEATGRVVGIDFGHAFGSATYLLPQPELVGVRLTRQITSVLRPLDAGVLLKAQMSHVLRALRAARDELLRVMDVFISEPQIDWAKHAKKLSAEQRRQVEEASGGDAGGGEAAAGGSAGQPGSGSANAAEAAEAAWVRSRLASVEAKLRGESSAHVTLSEVLLTSHRALGTKEAQDSLEALVMGPPGSIRRTLPATGLTPEQQVDVLVEQATDPDILARTYFGWKPWL